MHRVTNNSRCRQRTVQTAHGADSRRGSDDDDATSQSEQTQV